MIQLTALEIIPRNSVSLLNLATNDIYAFSEDHRMKLNPTKCKELLTNFMSNHNLIVNPIVIGGNPIAHFRVAACLSFKASPGAQPFKWKCCVFLCKSNSFPSQ